MKKLRLFFVLLGLSLLALVSWIFGIMMAVAQDLPDLENRSQYARAQNSTILDKDGERISTVTGNEHRILLESGDISPTLKQAVVAIEDQRFYEHRGVDFVGIARAVYQDILAGAAVQGASTITQQFVKNALAAQNSRTVMQKLREAALAYHIERQWSKDKILTEYLNSVYFGNGAYGIEVAARTYFGWNHPGCGKQEQPCAAELLPHEAAMLAGIISSPSAYDPAVHPEASVERRNIVLQKMVEQGTLSEESYDLAVAEPPPPPDKIQQPTEDSEAPFFTTWLRQQIIDYYGPGPGVRRRAADPVDPRPRPPAGRRGHCLRHTRRHRAPPPPVVVLDNDTASVRAMVGGSDYHRSRSTSPPTAIASRGRRGSRSPSPRRLMEGHLLHRPVGLPGAA